MIRALFIFITLLVCSPIAGLADNRSKLSGEIAIEEIGPGLSNYQQQENQALEFAKLVSDSLNTGNNSNITLSEPTNFYLSGLYLYCSTKSGSCPFILDTILAADYLNSQSQTVKSCPYMKKFWEAWIKNSFEDRLSYFLSIGTGANRKNFNEQKRPFYIKCEESLKSFKPDQQTQRSAALTVKLIEQLRNKKINVLEQTGAIKGKNSSITY